MDLEEININQIKDFRIGQVSNVEAATGCTVILAPEGAVGGVDVRGGSPATRETDLLDPANMVDKIHAVVLSGGSAFGLDSAAGVMEYLEKKGSGFDVGVTRVPIVCGASLFDLAVGDHRIRPDKEMGYQACLNSEKDDIYQGSTGAGTGATVGKYLGMEHAMKGGLGIYACRLGDLKLGVIVAVNCLGDVVEPHTGRILGGALEDDGLTYAGSERLIIDQFEKQENLFNENTTIGVVLTNASLTKAEANKLAVMAHDGYARTMRPSHSQVDGDTIFAMAAGRVSANINSLGALASLAVEKAVINAIVKAEPLYGFISYSELSREYN